MLIRRVNCTKRKEAAPHDRITHLGGIREGIGWMEGEADAIDQIEAQTHKYYTLTVQSNVTMVIVAIRNERKYLKTEADGERPDNLMNLPECP